MKSVTSACISWLLALLPVVAVTGWPIHVYEAVHTSSIFALSLLCLVIGGIGAASFRGRRILMGYVDVVCLAGMMFYMTRNLCADRLWNTGCVCLLSLYLSVRSFRPLRYIYFFYGALCALFLLATWGYLQYFDIIPARNPYFHLTGPFQNPGILGGIMSLLLAVILTGLLWIGGCFHRQRKLQLFSVCAILLFSLPVWLWTSARAAWVSLVVSLLYVWYCRNRKRKNSFQRKLLCGIGGVCVVGLLLMLYSLKPLSADGRMLVWRVSWQMIQEKPWAGFGKGGFEANYLYWQAKYMESGATEVEKYVAGNTHTAFNELIRVTVEHGLLGGLLYMMFFSWTIITASQT